MTRPILHRQSGSSGAHPSDRATRPADQAPAGLGDTASVPCAAPTLCERCEAATGADRELDGDIAKAVGWTREWVDHGFRKSVEWKRPAGFAFPIGTMAEPPFYTASVDAALLLVPDGWDWSAGLCTVDGFPPAEANVSPQAQPFPVELDITTEAATPALALCAAALRARVLS